MDQATAEEILKELRAQNPRRMRGPLILFGAMLFVFISVAIWDVLTERTKTSDVSWKEVNRAIDSSDLDRALTMAKELTEKTPHYPQAYAAMGTIYISMGDLEAGEKQYAHAWELFPSDKYRKYLEDVRKARARRESGQLETAHDSWRAVSSEMARLNTDAALSMAKRLVEKLPTYEYGHRRLAQIYLSVGDAQNAEKHFAKAYELFPKKDNQDALRAVRTLIEQQRQPNQ